MSHSFSNSSADETKVTSAARAEKKQTHHENKRRTISHRALSRHVERRVVVTVAEITIPAPIRIARMVAEAALVRDIAAFGAFLLFATMLSLLCGFAAPI